MGYRSCFDLQEKNHCCHDSYAFHHVFQSIYHFALWIWVVCILILLKIANTPMPKQSLGRRSAQTALYHITQAFCTLDCAYIEFFTADEMWGYIRHQTESVFLETWYEGLKPLSPQTSFLTKNGTHYFPSEMR